MTFDETTKTETLAVDDASVLEVPDSRPAEQTSPVCSYTEWDPLEEVVLGQVQGTSSPVWHVVIKGTAPRDSWELIEALSGQPADQISKDVVDNAQADLDGFRDVLESCGVTVRRPDLQPQTTPFSSPQWSTPAGYNIANPRDVFLVIGDQIIEAPMSWRSRQYETHAYRSLLKEYSRAGARWVAAPRPELPDELYDENYDPPADGEAPRYVTNEFEPVFDAADFVRLGRDLVCTRSNTTNRSGMEWLQRHLGSEHTIHELEVKSRQPMHIDTTIVPLGPGKLLVNPQYVDPDNLPAIFDRWEVKTAPKPEPTPGLMYDMSSMWLSMNVLSIDEKRVVVEKGQEPLMRMLEEWGFEPIPVQFHNYFIFGGAFHCSTLDVRRRGTLQSYA